MYEELIPFMAETYLIITHKTDPLESKAKKDGDGISIKEETTIGLLHLGKDGKNAAFIRDKELTRIASDIILFLHS